MRNPLVASLLVCPLVASAAAGQVSFRGFTPFTCSADGSTVGGSISAGGENLAALLQDGRVIDVNQLLESLGVDLQDWELDRVTAISADGTTIAGTARHIWGPGPVDIRTEGWIAAIPSPGAGTPVLLGACLLAHRRRR